MSEPDLSEHRLIELVDAWGVDPAGWPDEARTPSVFAALSDPTPALAKALAEARETDELLTGLIVAQAPAGLAERILADAPEPARLQWRGLGDIFRSAGPSGALWPAGAALASLATGVFIGLQMADVPEPVEPVDEAIYAALGLQNFDSGLEGDFE